MDRVGDAHVPQYKAKVGYLSCNTRWRQMCVCAKQLTSVEIRRGNEKDGLR
jgi:hypothetical protein